MLNGDHVCELKSSCDCISVYIIDDHQIIIDGIKKWFRPSRDHIDIVGSSIDIATIERNGIPVNVNIIILDLYLKFTDPIVNFRYLKVHYPCKSIIILSHEDDLQWQQRMLDLGASAYLCKSASREEVKHALEFVAHGGRIFSFNMLDKTHPKTFNFLPEMISDSLELMPNEKEIVSRFMKGFYPKTIAKETSTTECNVRQILFRLRKRFNVHSNIQLAIEIFRQSHPISSHSCPGLHSPDVNMAANYIL